MNYKATVAVAMSGGVDSAVSALLLKNAGYKVFGIFMKNWEDDDQCNSREDFVDAVSVAETLKIDILQVNFSKDYKKRSLITSCFPYLLEILPTLMCFVTLK